ncbi:MAG: hypothetical protein AB9844_10125 [Clostridiaceae bacterium]
MKDLLIYVLILVFGLALLTGCGQKIREQDIEGSIPPYGKVTVVLNKGDLSDVYDVRTDGLYKIGSGIEKIDEMAGSKSGTIAQLVYLNRGENMDNNHIVIYRNNKKMVLDYFFSASDLLMNPSGTRLAYRAYINDSYGSAQGLQIFDIENKEVDRFRKQVMISGNVYAWQDDDNIIYYGVTNEDDSYGQLYRYNAAEKKEVIYFDGLEGYCMYLIPAGEGLVYLESYGEKAALYYLDKNKKKTLITSEIYELYDADYNTVTEELVLAGKKEGESIAAVYRIPMDTFILKRVNYDFPKVVDSKTTLTTDSRGVLYFTGKTGDKEGSELDVFMYDYRNGSLSILSYRSGDYRIYGNVIK